MMNKSDLLFTLALQCVPQIGDIKAKDLKGNKEVFVDYLTEMDQETGCINFVSKDEP